MPLGSFNYDPLAEIDRYSPEAIMRRYVPGYGDTPELTPEETESLLATAGQELISGLAYIGESLGKPAAALGGLVAGRPQELANLIPFSDLLGITSSEGLLGGTPFQVTDDEDTTYLGGALVKHGIIPRNDPNRWEVRDFLEFGADLLGDPLLPVSGVAGKGLNLGGQFLKRAGLLDDWFEALPSAMRHTMSKARQTELAGGKPGFLEHFLPGGMGQRQAYQKMTPRDILKPRPGELDTYTGQLDVQDRLMRFQEAAKAAGKNYEDYLDEPIGGLFGLHGLAGFAPKPLLGMTRAVGVGGKSETIAAVLDELGRKVRHSRPAAGLRSLFDPRIHPSVRATGGIAQDASRWNYPVRERARLRARDVQANQLGRLERAGLAQTEDEELVRDFLENKNVSAAQHFAGHSIGPKALEGLERFRTDDSIYYDHLLSDKTAVGIQVKKLGDQFAAYHPRRDISHATSRKEFKHARRTFLKDWPGRSLQIDRVFQDHRIQTRLKKNPLTGLPWPDTQKGKTDQLSSLQSAIKQIWNEQAPQHGGLKPSGTFKPVKGYKGSLNRARKTAQFFIEHAKRQEEAFTKTGIPQPLRIWSGPMPDAALQRLRSADRIDNIKSTLGALADPRIYGRKMSADDRLVDLGAFLQKKLKVKVGSPMKPEGAALMLEKLSGEKWINLHNKKVSLKFANQLKKTHDVARDPSRLQPVIDLIDSITNYFKGTVTVPWPAFHNRNLVSALIRNFFTGHLSRRSINWANALIEGREIEGALKWPGIERRLKLSGLKGAELNDRAASNLLRQDIAAADFYGPFQAEVLAKVGEGLPEQSWETSTRAQRESLVGGYQPVLPGEATSSLGRSPYIFFPGTSGKHGEFIRELGQTAIANRPNLKLLPPMPGGIGGQIRGVKQFRKGRFGQAVEHGLEEAAHETTTGFVKAGEMIASRIEAYARVAPYLEGVYKGESRNMLIDLIKSSQVDYSRRSFTEFERRVMTRAFPFYKFCVPIDHEILTRRGWKYYHELAADEDVLSMDHETGVFHWVPLIEVNIFPHTGKLMKYEQSRKHKKINFLFTENHKWPVVSKNRGKVTRKIVSGCNLSSQDMLPCAGEYDGTDSVLSPRQAAILGWVVTDGCHRWRGNHCEMLVYQSPNKHLEEIVDLLGTEPRPPHPDTGVVAVPVALGDVKQITKVFAGKSDLPWIATHLSRDAAQLMWQAMMDAEGTVRPDGQDTFYQKTKSKDGKHVADAFQILCLLVGKSANISETQCCVKKSKHYHVHNNLSEEAYEGPVWCPTTKFGTWVMRHNGAVVVTGNSSRQFPFVAKALIHNPGGRMAKAVEAMAMGQGQMSPFTPEYLRRGPAIPMEPGESGAPRYLAQFGLMLEDPLQFAVPPTLEGLRSLFYETAQRVNPIVAGPAQLMLNKSFWREGRSLEDIDPPVGRAIENTLAWAKSWVDPNTQPPPHDVEPMAGLLGDRPLINRTLEMMLPQLPPFGRGITTLSRLTDYDRKALGWRLASVLSGVKVHDVTQRTEDAILREQLQKLLKQQGARVFEKAYIPKERKERLAREEPQRLRRIEQIESMLDKMAKEAKMRVNERKKELLRKGRR